MASVDPADDSIRRFVVNHYRYDSERRQRRWVTVAAFDTAGEFLADVDRRGVELRLAQLAGVADPREHFGRVIKDSP